MKKIIVLCLFLFGCEDKVTILDSSGQRISYPSVDGWVRTAYQKCPYGYDVLTPPPCDECTGIVQCKAEKQKGTP